MPAWLSIEVVLQDETEDISARVVQRWTSRFHVVMGAVHAGNSVWALVERVVSPCGATVMAWWRGMQVWLRHIVWTYLDGGNGVGKIPS